MGAKQVGITSILLCENIGLKYAGQITNMQVNIQLIDLGIALDFKGCMLDIKIKKGCMLDICRYIIAHPKYYQVVLPYSSIL
jgi:hypothetical protein